MHLNLNLCMCVSSYLSIYQFYIYISIYIDLYRSMCLSVYLCICVTNLSIYLPYLFLFLFLYLYLYPYLTYLPYLSVCLFCKIRSDSWHVEGHSSRTTKFCETSSIFDIDTFKIEAILRDFLHKSKVECRDDGLVPMRFAIFPLLLSKVLRLPWRSKSQVIRSAAPVTQNLPNPKIWCYKMQPLSGISALTS